MQIIKETGRVLHTHDEPSQQYHAIKLDKIDLAEASKKDESTNTIISTTSQSQPYIDVSKLTVATIDSEIYADALRHKMTM